MQDDMIDAIVVPGGGSQRDESCRSLPASVRSRLDAAIQLWYSLVPQDRQAAAADFSGFPRIIVLSAGTVHRPNFINSAGWPVLEATSEALYVLEVSRDDYHRPIPPQLILRESLSLDTIGNAYFLRTMHTDVAGFRRLHVITSGFHLPRTRAIFEFMFSIPQSPPPLGTSLSARTTAPQPRSPYVLTFQAASDEGVERADREARSKRELASLRTFRQTLISTFGLSLPMTAEVTDQLDSAAFIEDVDVSQWRIPEAAAEAAVHQENSRASLRAVHEFLFTKHTAYATHSAMIRSDLIDPAVLNTY